MKKSKSFIAKAMSVWNTNWTNQSNQGLFILLAMYQTPYTIRLTY